MIQLYVTPETHFKPNSTQICWKWIEQNRYSIQIIPKISITKWLYKYQIDLKTEIITKDRDSRYWFKGSIHKEDITIIHI